MIGFLSAIGLGFLINDLFLFPLLLLFLIIKVYSSYKNKQKHGNKYPYIITITAAILIFPSLWFPVGGYVIVGIIFFVAVWDLILIKNGKRN